MRGPLFSMCLRLETKLLVRGHLFEYFGDAKYALEIPELVKA